MSIQQRIDKKPVKGHGNALFLDKCNMDLQTEALYSFPGTLSTPISHHSGLGVGQEAGRTTVTIDAYSRKRCFKHSV